MFGLPKKYFSTLEFANLKHVNHVVDFRLFIC